MDSFFVKVVFLGAAFVVMACFRKRIAEYLSKIPLPAWALYFLTAIPLIIVEEDINCMASWCGTVFIPPTLPYLLIELAIVYVIWRVMKKRNIVPLCIAYCVFGIVWEMTLGGLRGASLPLPFYAFFVLWVGISYAFVSLLPLTILETGRKA